MSRYARSAPLPVFNLPPLALVRTEILDVEWPTVGTFRSRLRVVWIAKRPRSHAIQWRPKLLRDCGCRARPAEEVCDEIAFVGRRQKHALDQRLGFLRRIAETFLRRGVDGPNVGPKRPVREAPFQLVEIPLQTRDPTLVEHKFARSLKFFEHFRRMRPVSSLRPVTSMPRQATPVSP